MNVTAVPPTTDWDTGCTTITGASPTPTDTVVLTADPTPLPTSTSYGPESAVVTPAFW